MQIGKRSFSKKTEKTWLFVGVRTNDIDGNNCYYAFL